MCLGRRCCDLCVWVKTLLLFVWERDGAAACVGGAAVIVCGRSCCDACEREAAAVACVGEAAVSLRRSEAANPVCCLVCRVVLQARAAQEDPGGSGKAGGAKGMMYSVMYARSPSLHTNGYHSTRCVSGCCHS